MLSTFSLSPKDVKAAVFGLAGIDVPSQKITAEEMISDFGISNFKVMNDSFLGIKAGSPTGFGVCSINGTGTTAGGIDPLGKWLQIGGTGLYFGDEAGGGFIAGMAIRAVYDAMCRFGPQTILKDEFSRFFDTSCPMKYTESVYDKYYSGDVDVKEILTVLFNASLGGDFAASAVLERSGRQMGRSVAGCINGLNFPDDVNVVLAGSISLKCPAPVLLESFKDEIKKHTAKICNYIPLKHPPVAGAVGWAREMYTGSFDREFFDLIVSQILTANYETSNIRR
jgi:N-acetylglucosamine kinase-like BadF-type ATPase